MRLEAFKFDKVNAWALWVIAAMGCTTVSALSALVELTAGEVWGIAIGGLLLISGKSSPSPCSLDSGAAL